jgi:hypothetical protein
MKQGCKVYRRAGVTHVCYKGFHYAPKDDKTFVLHTDRVIITPGENPDVVMVQTCNQGHSPEEWAKTVIGDDNPLGYAQKPGDNSPKKQREPKKAKEDKKSGDAPKGTVVKLLTPELRASSGLPSDEEIDVLFTGFAKNPDALAVMRAIWGNWLRDPSPKSRAFKNPFVGLTYDDKEHTESVRNLGAALGEQFKDVYVR